MKAVVQRVSRAEVRSEGRVLGVIGSGLVTLLAIGPGDNRQTVEKMVGKILRLRIFEDASGKMNRSLLDGGGSHLLVSQFTLQADLSKGNRPSFLAAGDPGRARELFDHAVSHSRSLGVATEAGEFRATMQVELVNDGPATFFLEMAPEESA